MKSLRAPRPTLAAKEAQLEALVSLCHRLEAAGQDYSTISSNREDNDDARRGKRLLREADEATQEVRVRVADHRGWEERARALGDWLDGAEDELAEAAKAPEEDKESLANKVGHVMWCDNYLLRLIHGLEGT